MSCSCDGSAERPISQSRCPTSGGPGQPVGWKTVAALVVGPVPSRQPFWLCREPGCPVVYFADDPGVVLVVDELRVRPGFKAGGDLLCYCFLVGRSDIEREVATSGSSRAAASIAAEVKAGNCACDVRNPSGKCCLPEVRRAAAAQRTDPDGHRVPGSGQGGGS